MSNAKIQRRITPDGYIRLHEAVSDSVYVRGTEVASEGTLTQVLDELASSRPVERKLSLLHLSDNHGSTYGLNSMVATLRTSDDVIGLNTGDITSYTNINGYTTILQIMSDWNEECDGRPILMVKGNHDACDTNVQMNEKSCTATFLKPINNGFVKWGDPNASTGGVWNDNIVGGYWHKDVEYNGVKLRLIALDEYQHSVGNPTTGGSYKYSKVYSQTQVTWLVNLLISTPSDYYIVMVHHQPLYAEHPTNVLNDFVHHGINGATIDSTHTYTNSMFTYKPGNIDMAAMIVDAYLHKRNLVNASYPSGVDNITISINADFRDCTPAKFACHINGHVHGDYCEYHPDYPEQLCLTVSADSPSISSWYDDLVRSTGSTNKANHIINRVTIDANRDVVIVERLGADTPNTSLNWITQDGSARKRIEFAIPAIMEQPLEPAAAVTVVDNLTSTSTKDALSANQGKQLKGLLDTYCPIIEDTRSSAVAAITGVAPFATLEDGQRIILRFAYSNAANSTLTLTLSNSTTTNAIPLYFRGYGGTKRPSTGVFVAGCYICLIYDSTNARWMVTNTDYDFSVGTFTQAEIDAGTSTGARAVTPKLLVGNFAKVVTMVDNTASTGDVTATLDSGKFYKWGTIDSLDLTLTAAQAGMGIWAGKFTASSSWSGLTLPTGVDAAAGNDTIAGGKTYEFNIFDGECVVKEV